MFTWLTSWRKQRGLPVEAELRASKPAPSKELVRAISARLQAQPVRSSSRARLGFVGALAAATVGVLAASGGFSYAANSVVTAARATAQAVHLTAATPTANKPPASAAAQYLGPPAITKLSATSGVVPIGSKPGSSVTINGTNLGGIDALTVAGLSVDVSTITNSSTNTVVFKVPSSANSAVGPVVVHNPGGTASFGTFTVIVPPSIGASGLSVTSGSLTSLEPGQHLTITGTGFRGVDIAPGSVTIAGKPVKTFTVSGDTTIDATVPAGLSTTKSGNVVVKNAAGSSTSAQTVLGAAGPTISSLGKQADIAGNVLQITGAGFDPNDDTVTINGDNAPIVNSSTWTATKAFVTIPTPSNLNAVETGPVVITDGNGIGTAPKPFTTIVAPTISSFAPSPGTKSGGTITLTGLHFSGTSSVQFSSAAKVSPFKVVSDTTLTVVVPNDAVGGDTIRVTNAAGHADSGSVAVLNAPTINASGVTANNPAVAGDSVTIAGSNFVDTSTQHIQVFFGKVSNNGTPSNAGHTLTVTIPVGATTGKPKVVEAGGTATAGQTVTIASAPTVTTVPANAVADGTHSILIKGKGFLGTNAAQPTVTFGSGSTVTAVGATDTSITINVPTGAETGKITVHANTGDGVSKTTFTPIKTPQVNGVWPSQGQKVGGTLTILGTHLSGATAVTFAGVAKTSKPAVISDGAITVKVPAGATGNFTVTNAAGGSNTGTFTVLLPPTIGSMSVAGSTLTINGTNFVDTDDLKVSVKIGTAVCTGVTVVNPAKVTCTIPGSVAGKKMAVTLTEEAGTAKSALFQF